MGTFTLSAVLDLGGRSAFDGCADLEVVNFLSTFLRRERAFDDDGCPASMDSDKIFGEAFEEDIIVLYFFFLRIKILKQGIF